MSNRKTQRARKNLSSGKVASKKPKPSTVELRQKKKISKKTAKALASSRPTAMRKKPKASKKIVKILKTTQDKAAIKLSPRERKMQDIKKILQMQRNALLAGAEAALNMLPGQTIFPDLGDQASAEIDRNFMLRLKGREQRLLKKIETAIDKIDNGTFGICEICGQGIGIKRLEARPVTTMCIACKTEQEEEEKLKGHGEF